MGVGKKRTTKFLAAHPVCCFCGGEEPSTTIDHIPARSCFVGRQWPEGFEFPACAQCQNASRKDELAFSFYVRALDGRRADDGSMGKMLEGLANNLPEFVPDLSVSAREKRSTYSRMGLIKPAGSIMGELPVFRIPLQLHDVMMRYAMKIACAIFYREKGRVAPTDYCMHVAWGQAIDRKFIERSMDFIEMTPMITVGSRSNFEMGNQFIYRCNKADDPDVLALIAIFGKGVVLQMLVLDADSAQKLDEMNPEEAARGCWTRVGDMYSANAQ